MREIASFGTKFFGMNADSVFESGLEVIQFCQANDNGEYRYFSTSFRLVSLQGPSALFIDSSSSLERVQNGLPHFVLRDVLFNFDLIVIRERMTFELIFAFPFYFYCSFLSLNICIIYLQLNTRITSRARMSLY